MLAHDAADTDAQKQRVLADMDQALSSQCRDSEPRLTGLRIDRGEKALTPL